MSTLNVGHDHRSEPNVRHLSEKNLGSRFGKLAELIAPSASFEEETIHEGSIFWSSLEVVL